MIDDTYFRGKTAAYFTLGCKLNFAETSMIARTMQEAGIREVRRGEQADYCIVNTCSVTHTADRKCRQAIRTAHSRHPKARIIVTGCYAQLQPEVISAIDGVDVVIGAEQKKDIIAYLNADNSPTNAAFKDITSFMPACSKGNRTRYFLKVQDGCDYFCTYCTIPHARGRSRNTTIASLTEQARGVADEGGKEIVLTGVNIGDFGKTTGEAFLDLLRALDDVEGIERYRISSLEPDLLTDEVIAFAAQSKRFMPHFHLPLQSGSDEMLRLMHRRYDTELFRSRIERLRSAMPDVFIGIDVIVGCRGETEQLFDETYRFLQSIDFAQLHVFSYSERPNTQALRLTPIVSPQEKQRRSRMLLDLSDSKLAAFYNKYIGATAQVLWEHTTGRSPVMYGFTDNYIKVQCPNNIALDNQLTQVALGEYNNEQTALICEPTKGMKT